MFFHHDNATARTSAVAMVKMIKLGYELQPHPPYSPDLAPCGFFLFPNLKKSLAGQKFELNEEVIVATEAYFTDLQKTCFSNGLKKLEHRWVKCVELKRDYVEKYIATFLKFLFFFCRLSSYRTALVEQCTAQTI